MAMVWTCGGFGFLSLPHHGKPTHTPTSLKIMSSSTTFWEKLTSPYVCTHCGEGRPKITLIVVKKWHVN